jgi:hypothetical protein
MLKCETVQAELLVRGAVFAADPCNLTGPLEKRVSQAAYEQIIIGGSYIVPHGRNCHFADLEIDRFWYR